MSGWKSLFTPPQDALASWRLKMWQRCQAVGFPSKKTEGYAYVPLAAWRPESPPLPSQQRNLSALVFLDGAFQPELSSIPASIVALPLSVAMRSYGLFLQNRLQKILKEETDFFALLNGACHQEGLFLYVPPGVSPARPIEIIHNSSSKSLSLPRIHCVVGKGAKVQIIHRPPLQGSSALIDCVIDEKAEVALYDLSTPVLERWQTTALRALVKKEGVLRAFFLAKGEGVVRTSFAVELAEEQSEAEIQGLSLLSEQAQAHVQGKIEHKAPHCRSRQHIRSALYGSSKASFEGKIFVHPEAQKTEAYQLSQALLLSPLAAAFARPNLEIFADDVKASHGATVSELDEETLFYLRSRGLSADAAQKILVEGFCREFLQKFPEGTLNA